APPPGLKTMHPYKLSKIRRAAEIGGIFEGSFALQTGVATGYMAQSVCNDLDKDRVDTPPYLTDDYSKYTYRPGDSSAPIDLASRNFNGQNAADVAGNLNKDTFNNRGNIRFRHMNDTVTNVLMMDGHVQSFKFKKGASDSREATDLLRSNICVNR